MNKAQLTSIDVVAATIARQHSYTCHSGTADLPSVSLKPRVRSLLTVAMLSAASAIVWAGEDTGTGADVASEQDQAVIRSTHRNLRDAKAALADAYAALRKDPNNIGLQDAYNAALQAIPGAAANDGIRFRQSALAKVLPLTAQDVVAGKQLGVAVARERKSRAGVAKTVTGQAISVSQHPQITGFYCGPASGQSIAEHWRRTSAYDGKKPTQDLFAGIGYMKTNANGATTWASNAYSKALNRYIGYNFYVAKDSPSADYLWHAVTTDISNGHPIAMDAVYFKGADLVLKGHPNNKTRGHWIVIKGWYNNKTITYIDPAHNSPAISWGDQVPVQSTYGLSSMTKLASSNGIVW